MWETGGEMPNRFVEIQDPIGNGASWARSFCESTLESILSLSLNLSSHVEALVDSIPGVEIPNGLNETVSVVLETTPAPRKGTRCLFCMTVTALLLHWIYVTAKFRHILSAYASTRKTASQ